MKKLLLIVIVLLPVIVTAAPTGFMATWDIYPYPTASMQISCGIGIAAKTPMGTAIANTGTLSFNMDVQPGETINCIAQAVLNGDVSPNSLEASLRLPLVLPAPVLRIRVVP